MKIFTYNIAKLWCIDQSLGINKETSLSNKIGHLLRSLQDTTLKNFGDKYLRKKCTYEWESSLRFDGSARPIPLGR